MKNINFNYLMSNQADIFALSIINELSTIHLNLLPD